MEKILVVLNSRAPAIHTIDFACRMAKLAGSRLTGVFIENIYSEYLPGEGLDGPYYFNRVKEATANAVTTDTEQAIRIFKEECERKGLEPETYVDKGEPIQEMIYESRFADLIIVDPGISSHDREEQLPSHFVKEILANAECPVLLSPEKFDEVEEIVFCYDNSASSVFAIKQFTYLLPAFTGRQVMLLEVNRGGKEEFNENHRRMMEWLRAHYHTVYYHALRGDVKDELFTYFFMRKKKMIVMGAYGRSLLSNFFKKSNADVLMRMVDLPMFITHY